MGVNKKQRKPKTSQGIHGGGGKTRLTETQKVLMGRGRYDTFRPVGQGHREER